MTRLFQTKKTDINMNKRMKDPKGDLRFVHKSTRVYDFSSLKLTAMAYRRQGTIYLPTQIKYSRLINFAAIKGGMPYSTYIISNSRPFPIV